ncbi:MAG: Flp pilus assembly protein CpaB [Gemmatimonadetes bacterium]|nr:Flp pilus assembly protein CpaB [Gemmatimonadota bacterium]
MGDRRFLLVAVAALAVAATAAAGVFRYLRVAEARARVPMAPLVVAARDLPEGHRLVAADLRVAEVPRGTRPETGFAHRDSVLGRVTRVAVFSGEALVTGRLAPLGASAGLEVKITPGKRAMAVKIDEVAGVSGLIQPNSRVDVLVTLREEGNSDQQRAKLFMANMRVLAVGTQLERGPDGRPVDATTVALEVSPAEAEQLAVAANQGKIQLVLRGYGDPDTVRTAGASAQAMLRRLAVPVEPAPPPPPRPRAAMRPAPTAAAMVLPATPLAAPPAPAAPPAAPRRDSAVVQVYRRTALTQQKVARPDGTRPDSTPRP